MYQNIFPDLIEYPQYLHLPIEYIQSKISEFLAEDMPSGDVTTDSIIPITAQVTADIQALEKQYSLRYVEKTLAAIILLLDVIILA